MKNKKKEKHLFHYNNYLALKTAIAVLQYNCITNYTASYTAGCRYIMQSSCQDCFYANFGKYEAKSKIF